MRKRDREYLAEYRSWLQDAGLKASTVDNHVFNAELYLDEYLKPEKAGMEDGADPNYLEDFFSEFYIRDLAWSTPSNLKATAASLKKFYRCMYERGHIGKKSYDLVSAAIRDRSPHWQKLCREYNDELLEGSDPVPGLFDLFDFEDDAEDPGEDGPSELFLPDDFMTGMPEPEPFPVPDRVYELAFDFKKAKLWNRLRETEIFAVRLPGDRIGYCCVTGRSGQNLSLSVYRGEEAFRTFYRLPEMDLDDLMLSGPEELLTQDCVQLGLENKDDAGEKSIASVRAYAAARGITLRGAHCFPVFYSFKPFRIPWPITEERDMADLETALEAAAALSQMLREPSARERLGFHLLDLKAAGEVPLLEKAGEAWQAGKAAVPGPPEKPWPEPGQINDVSLAKLRRMQKRGLLECGITYPPMPVAGIPPFFPALLLTVDPEDGQILPPVPGEEEWDDADSLLKSFLDMLLEAKYRPAGIRAWPGRTAALLQRFCEKAKIPLEITEEMEYLEDVADSLMDKLDAPFLEPDEDEQAELPEALVRSIMDMTDEELRRVPRDLLEGTIHLSEMGLLPKALARRLRGLVEE